MAEKEIKTCFVITPIGNPDDPIRRHIDGIIDAAVIPAFQDKYEVRVAHRILKTGSITKQVIEEIYNGDLVVVNLTEKNPNVMYELAFRHSVGKPVIVIAQEGTKLPFDITDERTLFYKNDMMGVLELKKQLMDMEQSIDFERDIAGGMIYDYLRQIGIETKLIATHAEEDGKGTLSYILQRLDSIEGKLSKAESTEEKLSKTELAVQYEESSFFAMRVTISVKTIGIGLMNTFVKTLSERLRSLIDVTTDVVRKSKTYLLLSIFTHERLEETKIESVIRLVAEELHIPLLSVKIY